MDLALWWLYEYILIFISLLSTCLGLRKTEYRYIAES